MVPLLYIQELFTLTKTPAKVEFCAFYSVAAKNIEVITMTEYRRSAHSVYDIKYHLVWIDEAIAEYIRNQELKEEGMILR